MRINEDVMSDFNKTKLLGIFYMVHHDPNNENVYLHLGHAIHAWKLLEFKDIIWNSFNALCADLKASSLCIHSWSFSCRFSIIYSYNKSKSSSVTDGFIVWILFLIISIFFIFSNLQWIRPGCNSWPSFSFLF